MASATIHSDFGAQENKICHFFHFFLFYLPWSDGTRCHGVRWFFFFNVEFQVNFFTLLFHPPSRGSWVPFLSAIRVVVVYLLSHVWLFTTLWALVHQVPLSIRFPRKEYWSGLPFPSPGDLPDPYQDQHMSSALADGFFTAEPPGKPQSNDIIYISKVVDISPAILIPACDSSGQVTIIKLLV